MSTFKPYWDFRHSISDPHICLNSRYENDHIQIKNIKFNIKKINIGIEYRMYTHACMFLALAKSMMSPFNVNSSYEDKTGILIEALLITDIGIPSIVDSNTHIPLSIEGIDAENYLKCLAYSHNTCICVIQYGVRDAFNIYTPTCGSVKDPVGMLIDYTYRGLAHYLLLPTTDGGISHYDTIYVEI